MVGGEIKVVMTLDSNDFSVKTVKAGEVLAEFKQTADQSTAAVKNLESSFGLSAKSVSDLGFAFFVVRSNLEALDDVLLSLPKAVMNSSAEFQQMQKLMEGLSQQTDDAKRKLEALTDVKYIINMALSSPFDINSLQTAFVRFKSVGLDPLNGSLKAVADSVAKIGGNGVVLDRVALAIQQMAGKGVVSMEELRRQMGEALPQAMQYMAEGVGMSMQKLIQVVSHGQLESKTALQNMFTVMAIENRNASEEMMRTWNGAMAQLKTQWELFKKSIAGDPETAGTFSNEMAQGVQKLNQLLNSEDAKKFAYDLGQAMANAVTLVEKLVSVFTEFGGAIKFAGLALASYFAAQKWAEIVQNMRLVQQAAQDVVATGDKTQRGKGGIFQSYLEGATAAKQAVIELATKQKIANNDKIRFNQDEIESNRQAIRDLIEGDKEAYSQRVLEAQQAMEAQLAQAEQLKDQEAALITERQERYRDYIAAKEAYDREYQAAMASAYTGRGGSANNIERLADVRNALNAELSLMNQKIAANRQLQQTLEQTAAAEIDAAMASERYSIETREAVSAKLALNSNLKEAITTLRTTAEATSAATMATSAFRTVIGGLGSVFTAMGGWVTVAITALTYLGEKLMEWINRWKTVDEIVNRIKQGIATAQDNKNIEDGLSSLKASLKTGADLIDSTQRDIARLKQRYNDEDDATTKAHLKAQLDEKQKYLDSLFAAEKTAAAKEADLQNQLNVGKNIVLQADAQKDANYFKQIVNNSVEDRVKILKKAHDDLKQKALDIEKSARDANPDITPAEVEKLTADVDKQVREKLVAMNSARLSGWIAARKVIDEQIQKTTDATKSAALQGMLKEADQQIKELQQIDANAKSLGTAQIINKNQGDHTDRVDPFKKYVQEQQAKLAEAETQLRALNDKKDILVTEEQKATLDVLKKLANGEFNFKMPGKDEQANNFEATGQAALKAYLAALKEGKGDVDSFVSSLNGLSAAQRAQLLEGIQDAAKQSAMQKEVIAAVQNAQQRAVSAAEELKTAQDQLGAGVKDLPAGYIALARSFAQVEDKAHGALQGVTAFSDAEKQALHDSLLAGIINDSLKLDNELAAQQIKNIVNVRDREYASHEQRLKEIQETYDFEVRYSGGAQDTITAAQQKADKQRLIENAKFVEAYKSDLDKLIDQWNDLGTQADQAVSNLASGWIDALMNFVNTGKLALGDLVKTFAQSVEKMALQQTFSGIVKSAGDAVSSGLKGLFGIKSSDAQTNKYDTITGALLVKNVDGSYSPTGDLLNSIAGKVEGQNTQAAARNDSMMSQAWDKFQQYAGNAWGWVQDKWSVVSDYMKSNFGDIVSGLGSSFSNLFSYLGSLLSSLFASQQASSAASDYAAAAAVAAFANGGIMSGSGPLPLRKYANGGIADSPQLALFGEGSMNEAYVPLPDGRSIPVTVKSEGSNGAAAPNVTLNVINQTGQQFTAKQGNVKFDGKQMVLDVVLAGVSTPGPFRDGMRSAMGVN
jgi:tape measure domain-containing protein